MISHFWLGHKWGRVNQILVLIGQESWEAVRTPQLISLGVFPPSSRGLLVVLDIQLIGN